MPRSKNPEFINWRGSLARAVLLEDLVKGRLHMDNAVMPAQRAWDLVYSKMEEFKEVKFEQFKARLADHRRQVQRGLKEAHHQEACLKHDRELFPRQPRNHRGELVFDMHPAKLLLRQDVINKAYVNRKPKDLWLSRDEYQEFKLSIFRHRIYQEIRRWKHVNRLEMKRAGGHFQL